mmetsp:Transcript_36899/g.101826  ORF Transcript_36899/g.101826 Transcript_36899/m.101826 type:complete len:267 (-) Transcript_36899:829-1629(-)
MVPHARAAARAPTPREAPKAKLPGARRPAREARCEKGRGSKCSRFGMRSFRASCVLGGLLLLGACGIECTPNAASMVLLQDRSTIAHPRKKRASSSPISEQLVDPLYAQRQDRALAILYAEREADCPRRGLLAEGAHHKLYALAELAAVRTRVAAGCIHGREAELARVACEPHVGWRDREEHVAVGVAVLERGARLRPAGLVVGARRVVTMAHAEVGSKLRHPQGVDRVVMDGRPKRRRHAREQLAPVDRVHLRRVAAAQALEVRL